VTPLFATRTAATLLLALAAALLFEWLRLPLPWMLGPLLATASCSIIGMPVASWGPLRNAGQCLIGTGLGLYFTPDVVTMVGKLWWAIALSVVWALLLGAGFSKWLMWSNRRQMPGLTAQTTFFAGSIGGASEMTILAERHGARTDLVAAGHSLRVLIVTISIPFALQYGGWQGLDPMQPASRLVDATGLAMLMPMCMAGALLMQKLGRANPWFLGAFFVSMLLSANHITLSGMPPSWSHAAQLFIGVSLGVRFTPAFVHAAPRWMLTCGIGSVVLIGVCAVFGWLLSMPIALDAATMILSTAPGGISEMAITAQVLHLGVPIVTAFQVCRLLAVLVLVEPVFRYGNRRLKADLGAGK